MSYQQQNDFDDLWDGIDDRPAGGPNGNGSGGGRSPLIWVGLIGGLGLLLVICLGAVGVFYLNSRDQPTATPPPLAVPPNETATAVAANLTAAAPTATPLPDATDDNGAAPTVTLAASVTPTGETPAPPEIDEDTVSAARLSSAPVIDGNLGDWPAVATVVSAYRVFANSGWDGSSDLEATWQLGWDDQYLYIGVVVVDDRHVQTQTGNQIWRGDSVDMQLDTNLNGDANSDSISPDDYQVTFSPGDFGSLPPSAFRFRGTPDGQMLDFTGHNIVVAATAQGESYTLEAAIPWSDLGLSPAAGLTIGLALNASDNDTPNTAVQEVMMSHVSTRRFANPQTWGKMTLLP